MNTSAAEQSNKDMILIEHLPFAMDGGIAERSSIGLIVLATDYTIEYEFQRIFGQVPGIGLYHT